MNIRPATPKDAPAINVIRNFYIRTTTSNLHLHELPDSDMVKMIVERDEKTPFFAVEKDGRIIGYGSIGYFGDRAGYRVTAELGLYLSQDAVGGGIGKRLLEFLVSETKRLGFHSVISRITQENAVSIYLHEKAGFQRVGVLKEIGRKFDRYVDVYFFQKLLN